MNVERQLWPWKAKNETGKELDLRRKTLIDTERAGKETWRGWPQPVIVMLLEVCACPEGQLRPSEQGAGPDGSSVGGSHSTPHMDPNFKQRHWPRALGDSSPVPSLAPEPAWPTKAIRLPPPHLFRPQPPLQIRVGRRHPPLGWVLSSHRVAARPLPSEAGP